MPSASRKHLPPFGPASCGESSSSEPRSVLIVKPSSLGDIVHALPCLAALRHQYPALEARWLANPEWAPLLEDNPLIDEVIPFPRKSFKGLRATPKIIRWLKELKNTPRQHPEVVIDLQGLFRSAFIGRARAISEEGDLLVGPKEAREGGQLFYGHSVPSGVAPHAVDRNLAILAELGVPTPAIPEFPLPPGIQPDLPLPEQFVLVHPHSRGNGKSLSIEALQTLCAALQPLNVVLVGIDSENTPAPPNTTDIRNQTGLAELVWLCRKAQWVISVDSGPMHIAAAVNPNTLGIHTWSDPLKVGPYGKGPVVWRGEQIATAKELGGDRPSVQVSPEQGTAIGNFVRDRLGDKHPCG